MNEMPRTPRITSVGTVAPSRWSRQILRATVLALGRN